jgi:hypothetical protein
MCYKNWFGLQRTDLRNKQKGGVGHLMKAAVEIIQEGWMMGTSLLEVDNMMSHVSVCSSLQ